MIQVFSSVGNELHFFTRDFKIQTLSGNTVELRNDTVVTSFKNQKVLGKT